MKYLEQEKVCGCCGYKMDRLPKNARFFVDEGGWMEGWYWNCRCGSTLFAPVDKVYILPEKEIA